MRYFIEFSYIGKNYKGLQIQKKNITIIGEIKNKLSIILKKNINLITSCRTDKGVNAIYNTCHFDINEHINTKEIVNKLNKYIKKDINIINIFKVKDNIHSRYSVIYKTYKYIITKNKNPFYKDISWYIKDSNNINIYKIQKTIKLIYKINNFYSFSNSYDIYNLCHIRYIKIFNYSNFIIFIISSNRFLKNMIRIIIGVIIKIGYNKLSYKNLLKYIYLNKKFNYIAPPQGLLLINIKYNYNNKYYKNF